MSVFGDGMGAMVHFQHGPTLNITDTVFIYLAEILEPKSEAFNVVPTERVTLNDDFQLSITDELFSTYRFGFFDLKGERVFFNQWNDSRILNTTISITGNFTVFAQALTNHDQIVEWTSSIEVYQVEDPKNNTDTGNNGNNNNHGTSTSKKRKLKPYAIALIVLACVFIIIIALALVATLVAILYFRKRKSKQNAEEDKYNNKNDTEMEMRCETK